MIPKIKNVIRAAEPYRFILYSCSVIEINYSASSISEYSTSCTVAAASATVALAAVTNTNCNKDKSQLARKA